MQIEEPKTTEEKKRKPPQMGSEEKQKGHHKIRAHIVQIGKGKEKKAGQQLPHIPKYSANDKRVLYIDNPR